jgi:hypothetical protein
MDDAAKPPPLHELLDTVRATVPHGDGWTLADLFWRYTQGEQLTERDIAVLAAMRARARG